MMHQSSEHPSQRLPTPGADELAHSERLLERIRGLIRDSGPMPFWQFMEQALYAPGLGYYSAGRTKFGAAGDFVTAPELGDLFAETLAETLAPVLGSGPDRAFIEVGGGSGRFAAAALAEWERLDALPSRYLILERSAELRERQQATLATTVPGLLDRVAWLDRPPEQPWHGVLFANEVIDALPVHRFLKRKGELCECCVAIDARGELQWVDGPADAMLRAAVAHIESDLGVGFAERYQSELLPQLPFWIDAILGTLETGMAVFVDYGYPRREYYLPERSQGTLTCHYRHRAHDQVLLWPGLQDLTAWVDFTALAEAGTRIRLPLAGFNSQAQFLLAAGLLPRAQAAIEGKGVADGYALAQEVKELTLPGAMGERFKVMSFARGIDHVPAAFTAFDQRHRL